MGRRNSNATKVNTRPRHARALKSSESVYVKLLGGSIYNDMRILADNGDGTVSVGHAWASILDHVPSGFRAVPLANIYYSNPGA